MRVCRVGQSFDKSLKGLSSHLIPLTNAQARNEDYTFHVVSEFPKTGRPRMCGNVYTHYFSNERRGLWNVFPFSSLHYGFKAYDVMKTFDYDLIHGHQGVCLGLVFKKLNKPFVYTCHDAVVLPSEHKKVFKSIVKSSPMSASVSNVSLKSKYRNYLLTKLLIMKASEVTAVSDYVKSRLVDYYGLNEEEVHVTPPGVDLDLFKPVNVLKSKEEFTCLYVGRFIRRKGIRTIQLTINHLLKEGKDVNFVLVGGTNPVSYERVKRLETLHPDNVTVKKWVSQEELVRLYNKANVLLHPSIFEACAKIILEALACGTPVITCPDNGLSKKIEEHGLGLITEYGNHLKLAEKILQIKRNPPLNGFIKQCRDFVKNYTWNETSKKYEEVYEKALKK